MTDASSASPAVRSLWIKRAHRGPMDPVEEVTLVQGKGIEGNADQGGWRQVTLIEEEVFQALKTEVGEAVEPALRRANVLVRGIRLEKTRDRVLRIGDARIRIRGETRPCHRMDEAVPGLRKALAPAWRGGAFGRVIQGGRVRVGDAVEWEDDEG